MIDGTRANRVTSSADVLLRCLIDCDIELDGETIVVRASEQCNPNRDYRLEIAKEICGALRDLQKIRQEDEK